MATPLLALAHQRGYLDADQLAQLEQLAAQLATAGRPVDEGALLQRFLSPQQLGSLRPEAPSAPADRGAATVSLAPEASPQKSPSGRIQLPGETPRRLGPYAIRKELARGGMGAVYVAHHEALERDVALKVMLQVTPRSSKRFEREARATARLDHPNIVKLHDVGSEGGTSYLVMDLVDGEPLSDRVEREGPLALREAARITERLARALHYAHEQGVLHRDMKPSNVLLDARGEPRITDFGLAQETAGAHSLTKTGQLIGTPAYMPPEQATGQLDAIGPRSDVYSLGATLYFLLTGQAPFGGEMPMNVVIAVTRRKPDPPRALRPEIDRALQAICLRCLEKSPDGRYPNAADLADALAGWLALDEEGPTPLPKGLIAVLAALAALVVGGAVYLFSRPETSARPTPPASKTQGPVGPQGEDLARLELADALEADPRLRARMLRSFLERYPGHTAGQTAYERFAPWSPVRASEPKPSSRTGVHHGLVFDAARGVVLLFGGADKRWTFQNDTWTWDGVRWALATPRVKPHPRHAHALVYDPHRELVLLMGGYAFKSLRFRNDVWEWDGREWQLKLARNMKALMARAWHGAVYDERRREVLVFGGQSFRNKMLNDTWAWKNDDWKEYVTGRAPAPRHAHAMAYDPLRGVTVVFGGFDGQQVFGDTWEWDGKAWRPRKVSGRAPAARKAASLVFDGRRLLLFGGSTAAPTSTRQEYLNDLWAWDGARWEELAPAASPRARSWHGLVWDPLRRACLVFGGSAGRKQRFGDLWLRPTPRAPAPSPGGGGR